jgi:site-specific DNA recombinase
MKGNKHVQGRRNLNLKVAAYCRSSLDKKIQEHSLDLQLGSIQAKATSLLFMIDEVYSDPAVSARKTKILERPELSRLLEDIRNDKVSTLFVYKRDRLARDVRQYMEIYELLCEKKVKVHFAADNEIAIQYSASGEFFELIMAGFNQREAEQIVQRIRETKNNLIRQAKHPGGRIPLGYETDNKKKYVQIENEASVVRSVYGELLYGGPYKNFTALIKHLNEKSIWNRGKNWSGTTLRQCIERPIYKGIVQFEVGNQTFELYKHKLEIIPEEEWELAQQKMQEITQTQSRITKTMSFLLNDLVYCSECQNPIKGKGTKQKGGLAYGMYVCTKHYRHRVPQLILEKEICSLVENFFKEITADSRFNQVIYEFNRSDEKKWSERFREVSQKIREQEKVLIGLTERWLTDKQNQKLQEHMLEIYGNLEGLKQWKSIMEGKWKEHKDFPERMIEFNEKRIVNISLADFSFEKQRELIKDLVYRIYLDRKNAVVILKHPFLPMTEVKELGFT